VVGPPSVRRVPLSARRSDDADVIRARLRLLLAEAGGGGWVPDDDPASRAAVDDAEPAVGDEVLGDEALGARDADDDGLPAGMGRHRSPGPTVRWSPGRVGARSLWLSGVLAALTLVVWTWLDRPRVEPVPAPPADSTVTSAAARTATPVGEMSETSSTVVVSVVGLVARPGLVTLPSGARVADAVEAAGGLLPEADPASVNLAAVLTDGQQIAVGVPGAAAPGGGGSPAQGSSGGPLNLNTATAAELDALPGIGPVLADRIVEHRTSQGPFRSIEELDDVPGIGPTIAGELADLVTV
jgi:competence protein ComEA